MSTNQLLHTTCCHVQLPTFVCSTRMLWSSSYDGPCHVCWLSTIMCTSMLCTTSSTTNASLPTIMCTNGLLRCTYDASSNASSNAYDAIVPTIMCSTRLLRPSYDGPYDAFLPTIMCSSLLCTTSTTTNARLSAIMRTNGLLCTSHASHATTKLYAIVRSKLLYGKEIDRTLLGQTSEINMSTA